MLWSSILNFNRLFLNLTSGRFSRFIDTRPCKQTHTHTLHTHGIPRFFKCKVATKFRRTMYDVSYKEVWTNDFVSKERQAIVTNLILSQSALCSSIRIGLSWRFGSCGSFFPFASYYSYIPLLLLPPPPNPLKT